MPSKQPVIAYIEHQEHSEGVFLAAHKIARSKKAPLWILAVREPNRPPDETARALEAFYTAAKQYDAQLHVFFDPNPARAAAAHVRAADALHLVTGIPGEIHGILGNDQGEDVISPAIPVTMIYENETITLPPRSILRMGSGILQSGMI